MAKSTVPTSPKPKKGKKGYILGATLMLSACGTGLPGLPSDPEPNEKVLAKIVSVCKYSGLFDTVSGLAGLAPVPGVAMGVNLVNAGVDKVCGDPVRFAKDASTIEWLIKNFRSAGKM